MFYILRGAGRGAPRALSSMTGGVMNTSKKGKLSKSERQELITSRLRNSPALRVSELASEIKVSTETIRRDLAELEERGLISRTYGGAARPMEPEPGYDERDRLFTREREGIAMAICSEVKDGEVLIIGSGATTGRIATRLAAVRRGLKIFTDSTAVAAALSQNPTFRIRLLPGIYNGDERCVCGPETVAAVCRIFANTAILGASGFTGNGVSNADADIAETYAAMASRATRVVIAADHSKTARESVLTYCTWDQVSELVTDMAPSDPDILAALKSHGVQLKVTSGHDGGILEEGRLHLGF